MLRLTLFGDFSVAGADGSEFALKSRKAKALLAYLALPPGKTRSREEIMALLWSDRGEAQARASLRQVLTGLRKALGEEAVAALRITDDAVSLDPERVVVENGAGGDELLAGFHLHDPAFEEWLRDERLRLENRPVPDRDSIPSAPPDRPSIAVLPFTNMSGDPDQDYFSDGITEDIIIELSRFRELFVVSRNSSFSYKGKSIKVQAVGQDLGVGYAVEGSVRRSGDRLRVTVQLTDAASGNHVWAERYDRQLEDIFDLQDEITQSIVRLLPVRLHEDLHERVRRKPSENLTAYDCYLHGRWLLDHAFWQDSKALELLRKAVEIDPNCAHAHAYIALVHAYSVFTVHPLGEDPIAIARDNIERALCAGEGDHFIHAVAGEVYVVAGEHDLAMSHSDKSLALNPNDLFALCSRGLIVAYSGEPEAAVELLREAYRYDPLMPDIFRENLAEAYYLMRDYENALGEYNRWQNPSVHTFTHMAACYAQLGRQDEADAAARAFDENSPADVDFAGYAKAHARLCKHAEDAEHWLEGYRKAGFTV